MSREGDGASVTALYLLGGFLVLLLAGAVLAPLVEREPPDEELEELPPGERHEAAVEALAELEFEYRTDKLPEEEYRRLRSHYGRIALAAEEEMEGDGSAAGAASGPGEATSPRTCRGCGDRVPEEARFCPACGGRLEDEHEEA